MSQPITVGNHSVVPMQDSETDYREYICVNCNLTGFAVEHFMK